MAKHTVSTADPQPTNPAAKTHSHTPPARQPAQPARPASIRRTQPMRNFDNCQFGPLALRAILRERLIPGERVIGWSVAGRQARSFDVAMVIFMSMIPVVGTIITVAYAGRFRRFIVLTDTRLLMLDPSVDPSNERKRKPLLNVPLHAVVVAHGGKKNKFRVGAPGLGGIEIYTFQNDRPTTTKRLIAGLQLLAADSDATGRLIDDRQFNSEPSPP